MDTQAFAKMKKPQAGHAVRLKTPWRWGMLDAGEIGILDGMVGEDINDLARITFGCRGQAFRGNGGGPTSKRPLYVSCSGGPGTIGTPVEELVWTGETVVFEFWRWQDYPRADGGVPYKLAVPVWEWSPRN